MTKKPEKNTAPGSSKKPLSKLTRAELLDRLRLKHQALGKAERQALSSRGLEVLAKNLLKAESKKLGELAEGNKHLLSTQVDLKAEVITKSRAITTKDQEIQDLNCLVDALEAKNMTLRLEKERLLGWVERVEGQSPTVIDDTTKEEAIQVFGNGGMNQ